MEYQKLGNTENEGRLSKKAIEREIEGTLK